MNQRLQFFLVLGLCCAACGPSVGGLLPDADDDPSPGADGDPSPSAGDDASPDADDPPLDPCVGSDPLNCDDGNPCTTDECAPATGCVHTNNTDPCSDGDACTTGDACSGGVCASGAPVVCAASPGACPPPVCDSQSGQCISATGPAIVQGNYHVMSAADAAALQGITAIAGHLEVGPSGYTGGVSAPLLTCVGGGVGLHKSSVRSLDLPALTSIGGGLYFHQNERLWRVRAPLLATMNGSLYFHQNAALLAVDLGSLLDVPDYLYFHQNTALLTVDLGSLQSVGQSPPPGGMGYTYFHGNSALPSACVQALAAQIAPLVGDYLADTGQAAGPCPGAMDSDSDGLDDVADNCPAVANASQLDTDGDGLGDVCECLGVTCQAMDGCHLAGSCDAATGECSNPIAADGAPCSDNNDCTLIDTCNAGVCVAGAPVAGSNVPCGGFQCPQSFCEPANGVCSVPPNPSRYDGTFMIATPADAMAAASYSEITGGVYVDASTATSVSLPALRCVGDYLYVTNNGSLGAIDAPALVSIGSQSAAEGYLYVTGNPALTSLKLQGLVNLGGYAHIVGNPSLPNACGGDLLVQLQAGGFSGNFTNTGGAAGSCP